MKGYNYPGKSPIKQKRVQDTEEWKTKIQPKIDEYNYQKKSLESIKTKHYNTLESFKKSGMEESHADYKKVISNIKGVRHDIKQHTTLPNKKYPDMYYRTEKSGEKTLMIYHDIKNK